MNTNLPAKHVIGHRIKNLRCARGLSGLELASLLNYSQQHISRIEQGSVRLSIQQVYQIADSLNVEVSELLSGLGYQPDPFDKMDKVNHYFLAESYFI